MDEALREEYESTLQMAAQARERCYTPDGALLVMLKDKRGRAIPNPYLSEYHRLVEQARRMARDLGIVSGVEDIADGSLTAATETGDYDAQLGALLGVLARDIDRTEGHGKAALCRVYLDALRERRSSATAMPDTDEVDVIIGSLTETPARRLSVV